MALTLELATSVTLLGIPYGTGAYGVGPYASEGLPWVDRSSSLRSGSLNIDDTLGTRNTLTFRLRNKDEAAWGDAWPPRQGQSVRVWNRTPAVDLQNLLLWSEDYAQSAWEKGANTTLVSSTNPDPEGGTTATRVSADALGFVYVRQTRSVTPGRTYTLSGWLRIVTDPGLGTGNTALVIQWLDDASAVLSDNSLVFTRDVPVSGVWQRPELTATAPAGAVSARVFSLLDPPSGTVWEQWGFQLNEGSSAYDYTRTESEAYEPTPDRTRTLLFGGTIHNVTDWEEVQDGQLVADVQCVDYNQLPDRFRVTGIYESQTAGDIIRDLVTRYLSEERVSLVGVQDGPTLERVVFNYQSLTEALNELADLCGYAWYFDYDLNLNFFPRETNTAPINIEDGGPWRKLRRYRSRSQYRNQQYIRGGKGTTDPRTESFKGDGTLQTFTLAFEVATVPTITLNAVSQTVGIRGLESGKDWYWSKGDKQITQDFAGTPLTSADTLAVTYRGLYPIIILTRDAERIAERQTVEGGSGLYEAIEEDTNLDDATAAVSKADALLRKYDLPESVTFELDTREDDPTPVFRAGQLVTLNVSRLELSGEYLVESVRTTDVQSVYTTQQVRAVAGEALGGWVQFFRNLSNLSGKLSIRENELLTLVRNLTDSATVTDDGISYTTAAPVTTVGGLVGYTEVA